MPDAYMVKRADGSYMPGDEESARVLNSVKIGQGVKFSWTHARNILFHRKGMKLFHFAYDQWQPERKMYNGFMVNRSFESFRKDLTISAGFYTTALGLSGDVHLIAESLSFANMPQDRFELVYDGVLDVLTDTYLSTYTYDQIDDIVEELLGYM